MPKEDTQFKKGQSGNINGRPKGAVSIKTILKRFLSEEINTTNPITKQTESLSVADIIVLKQIGAAMGGDLAAAKWIEGIVKDEFADRNDSIPEAQVVSSDSDEDTEQEIRLIQQPIDLFSRWYEEAKSKKGAQLKQHVSMILQIYQDNINKQCTTTQAEEIRQSLIPKYQKCIESITAISDKQQQ